MLILTPPDDPALRGQLNRLLGARGTRWRIGSPGTPGALRPESPAAASTAGARVSRRYALIAGSGGSVLATVNGEPWAVRDSGVILLGSPLDTAWTTLPASPGFVPFIDALVNLVARAESPISVVEGTPAVNFMTRSGSTDTVGVTVAGIDPRESDLTPASAAVLARALRAEVVSGADFSRDAFGGQHRVDASGGLLLLGLALACAEFAVATYSH